MKRRIEYRREIDGLRAVAVLPVILFHADFKFFSGGYVGVDIFFVISGYLISSVILTELKSGTFSLGTFYERRARRILPALFLVLFFCVPFAWFWMLPDAYENFSQSLFATVTMSNNILLEITTDYFSLTVAEKPLLHTWSLAVEEQFYILFPFFIAVLWKSHRRYILPALCILVISSFGFAEITWRISSESGFYSGIARAWEILLGSLTAFYLTFNNNNRPLPNQILAGTGLLFILLAIFTLNRSTPFPSYYTLLPTIGTVLIILFATSTTWVGKILSHPVPVGIGLISYSAYLWHLPLFVFARIRSLNGLTSEAFVFLIIATLILAYFSWRFVETPFRDRNKIKRPRIIVLALSSGLIFTVIGLSGHFGKGFSDRLPPDIRSIAMTRYNHIEQSRQNGCTRIDGEIKAKPCIYDGNGSKKLKIAVFGDSHAEGYSRALINPITKIGGTLYQFTKGSCPPIPNVEALAHYTGCSQYFRNVTRQYIKEGDFDIIILAARWAAYLEGGAFDNLEGGVEADNNSVYVPTDNHNWQTNDERKRIIGKHIRENVEDMLKGGAKVILVYPAPETGWLVPDRLARAMLFKKNITASFSSTIYTSFVKRNSGINKILDAIGEHPNLIRIYPDQIFCNSYIDDRCIAHLNTVPLYFDDDHLSNMGNRMVAEKIMEHINIR